jgi:aerobic C4-dicarboxylate transport protein
MKRTPTSPSSPPSGTTDAAPGRRRKISTHWLYVAVIVAVVAGIAVGLIVGKPAASLAVLGTAFISLVKMMIAPIIFCTIVIGVGSVRKASNVGKVGGLALLYFICMSTFALGLGLLVGNLIHPGESLHAAAIGATYQVPAAPEGSGNFLLDIVPTSMFSALTGGSVMQVLFVALIVGFAVQAMGSKGDPVIRCVGVLQQLVFKILSGIMWVAPIGAFGAIAGVVGATGWTAIASLGMFVGVFYLTCAVFVVVILGILLKTTTGLSIFKILYYLRQEYLLIVATSSSEPALPRLIAKMEHLGVSKPVVGIVVPTGYSFNLDGTAIYLTMASLFVANAMGTPLTWSEQLSLLLFMIIASKGAAAVTGAGLATLGAGLQSHRPDLVPGVGLIVAVDRFMSEARALTNFSGNAVATLVISTWVGEIDRAQAGRVLSGEYPFDDSDMLDEHHPPTAEPVSVDGPAHTAQIAPR